MNEQQKPIPNARLQGTPNSAAVPVVIAAANSQNAIDSQNVINGYVAAAGTADTITFTSADGTVEYFRIGVPVRGCVPLTPFKYSPVQGLGVLAAGGATGVVVTINYWKPGAAGVGVPGAS